MNKPRIGKVYFFVRPLGDSFEHTEFTRHADGSAGFAADGYLSIHEGGPNGWRDALDALARMGFEELGEAKSRGIVPTEWLPSTQNHA